MEKFVWLFWIEKLSQIMSCVTQWSREFGKVWVISIVNYMADAEKEWNFYMKFTIITKYSKLYIIIKGTKIY